MQKKNFEKIKIIHIASHKGNIGDIFNHAGFYQYLDKIFDKNYSVKKIELRDFYYSAKNKKEFDKAFADYINTFDLCIIGGGGFFDAQWEDSETGTTLDFNNYFIDSIKVPVVINAMGYHEYPEKTSEIICKKFNNFINNIINKKNWFISIRNDGSLKRIRNRYKNIDIDKILKVPDNAFFTMFPPPRFFSTVQREKTIGICVTNDLFSKFYNGDITADDFNKIIARFINKQARNQRKIILLPHTPDDINIINKVMQYVDGYLKRTQIVIAPFEAISIEAVYCIAEYYRRCNCIVGMRFHSLIMGINLNIPTIALAGHQQVEALFSELNLQDRCIKVDRSDIDEKLENMINKLLNGESTHEKYNAIYKNLNNEKLFYFIKLQKFLDDNLYYGGIL